MIRIIYTQITLQTEGKGDRHCWKRGQQMQKYSGLAVHEGGGGAVYKLANNHVQVLSNFSEK